MRTSKSPHTLPAYVAKHFRKRDIKQGKVTAENYLNQPIGMIKHTRSSSVFSLTRNVVGSGWNEMRVYELAPGQRLFPVNIHMVSDVDKRTADALHAMRLLVISGAQRRRPV